MTGWHVWPGSTLRHPLARWAAMLVGIVVATLLFVFAFGVLVIGGLAFLAFLAARALTGRNPAGPSRGTSNPNSPRPVIEGQFVVVEPDAANRRGAAGQCH